MGRAEAMDFWSRRRAAVAAEARAADVRAGDVRAGESRAEDAMPDAAMEGPGDAEALEAAGLKHPDALEPGDDFAAYLKAALPQHLKRRALRRLWLSNPVLANVDGLVDYGGEFGDAATVLPGMQTAYQVGRGMLRHVTAQAEAAETAETAETDAVAETAAGPARSPEAEAEAEAQVPAAPEEAAQAPVETAEAPGGADAPSRRRMRFDFPDVQEAGTA